MIKAIIFDMDGVLIDSEHLKFQACRKTLQEYGKDFSMEDHKKGVGLNANEFWPLIGKRFGLKLSAEDAGSKWLKHYLPLLEKTSLNSKAVDVLKELKGAGLRLALASSSAMQEIDTVLKKFEENYFDAVVSGDEVIKAKPSPEIYLKAAEKLNTNPENCLAVEDSFNGIKSAKAAGMKCLAISTDYLKGIDLSQADYKINSLKEFDLKVLGGQSG